VYKNYLIILNLLFWKTFEGPGLVLNDLEKWAPQWDDEAETNK